MRCCCWSPGAHAGATVAGPWWAFLAWHVVAGIGLALLFTPSFTTGLAALPPRLYPYGSTTLGTLQQVAAAAGTALSMAVLSWRQAGLRAGGAGDVAALDGGTRRRWSSRWFSARSWSCSRR